MESLLTKSVSHFIYRMNVMKRRPTNRKLVIQLYFTFLAAWASEGQINDYEYRKCERLWGLKHLHYNLLLFPQPGSLFFFNVRHGQFSSYDHEAVLLKILPRTHHWWHVLGPFAWQRLGWIDCQIYRRIRADTYKSRLPAVQMILRVHNVTVSGCC